MIEGRFAELIAGQRQGVLVTLRKDGRPQLSNVNYAWYPEEQTIRVSTTDDRAKTGNMRRDPRVSFHITSGDFWSYVVVDGHAELSEVARDPHDAAVEELVDLYRAVQGEHPDWDDYRAAMVRDRRLSCGCGPTGPTGRFTAANETQGWLRQAKPGFCLFDGRRHVCRKVIAVTRKLGRCWLTPSGGSPLICAYRSPTGATCGARTACRPKGSTGSPRPIS
jgi:PPOX class probable F420-dependent enzyme